MIKKRSFSNIAVLVALIVALLSCLAVNNTWARYSSEFDGEATAPTAKFIVNVLCDENNNNLSVVPTNNGNFVPFEFVVSNTQEGSTSEIDQAYMIAMFIKKASILQFLSLPNNYSVAVVPMLFCTTDMDSSIYEIYQYVISGNIPNGVSFGWFQNFDVGVPADEFNSASNDELLPVTWFYQDGDTCFGDLSTFMLEPEYGQNLEFIFNKNTQNSLRFFLIFYAQGYLSSNVTIDFKDMQLVVYSTQTDLSGVGE